MKRQQTLAEEAATMAVTLAGIARVDRLNVTDRAELLTVHHFLDDLANALRRTSGSYSSTLKAQANRGSTP